MGKKIEYVGLGDWKIMVRLPEPLAIKVHGILMARGSTCAELVRTAVADYMDRVKTI